MTAGPMPFFIVSRHLAEDGGPADGRWAYIDRCPHGMDLGAIRLGPAAVDARTATDPHWSAITWEWADLGNGRCRISPSILAAKVHEGTDCHFGPGEFEFMWLEEGELRNVEPFATRYRERTGREP